MNANALSSSLTCIFLFFLTIGFLYGLWRGFSKSLTRLLIVIIVAVVSFFVVPSLTNTILFLDISSLGLSIGGITVKTIGELVTESLSSIEVVKELMNSSPTFTNFIQAIPAVIVNLVLFILFFFIAKMISMIFYWIISAIFFNKKKMNGKNKHRFIGGIIGGVQGLIVACIFLIPIFGFVNLSNDAQIALSQSKTEVQQLSQESSTTPPNTFDALITSDSSTESTTEISVDEALETVTEYTKSLENNFIYKTLGFVGVTKLSNVIFDELTTLEIDTAEGKKDFKLTTEAVEISRLYPYLERISNSEFDIQSNEFIDKIILVIEKSYNSPLLENIITEIIHEAATIWSDTSLPRDQRLFLGLATPDLGSSNLNEVLDNQILKIRDSQNDELKTKLVELCSVAKVANDTIKIADQVKESLTDLNVENLESLFENIVENETIKEVVKDVVNTETLENFGIEDEKTQTLIVDVVTNIIDAEDLDIKNEVAATKEIFALTEKITSTPTDTKVELDQNEVSSLVENLGNSTVITELIKTKQNEETQDGSNPIKDLDLSNTLSEETKENLEAEINSKITDESTKETLLQILLGKTTN